MRCERCGSGIISGRTECHICGAPVAAAPVKVKEPEVVVAPAADAPLPTSEIEAGIPGITMAHPSDPMGIGAAPPPSMGGGMRVSLTGEVFEAAPAPMPLRPPSGTGPRPPAPRPGAPTKGKQREYLGEDDAIPKGNPIVAVLLLIVLLGAGGGGGWWWWSKKQAPVTAVKQMMDSAKVGNWRAAMEHVDFGALEGLAGGHEQLMNRITTGITATGTKVLDYRIEEFKMEDNVASVKVWQKEETMGQTKEETQTLKLKEVSGKWKVDFGSMMPQAAGAGGGGGGR